MFVPGELSSQVAPLLRGQGGSIHVPHSTGNPVGRRLTDRRAAQLRTRSLKDSVTAMGDEKEGSGRRSEAAESEAPWFRREVVPRLWGFFFLLVLFALVLYFLWQAVPVLLLLFAGALIALALRFVSDSISSVTRMPPLLSLTLVLVLAVVGFGWGLFLAMPGIIEQVQNLGEHLEASVGDLERRMRGTDAGDWFLKQLAEREADGIGAWVSQLAGMFTMTFSAITGFFLAVIVGVFLAYNPGLYISGFLRLIPRNKRKRACEVIKELGNTLRWWIVGQLISMLVLAVTTWLMLLILGVPLAFILGLLTGVLTFIPYLGPIIALIPILLIAFVESPVLALWVLALYLVIQNLEANVLMPIIFQKTVHLPPVLTIIAQVLLGILFGFTGIILATPLMAAGILVVKMIYVQDVIGDEMKEPVKEYPA
jgi:predicted PurR-regulated permease PerM